MFCIAEDSSTLGAVCERAVQEISAERSSDAQPTPSGPASKALQPYIDMLRRLSSPKLDVRREAATVSLLGLLRWKVCCLRSNNL